MANPEASKVKKCLFGPVNHEQLQEDLRKELGTDLQEMNKKYDFNFKEGTPLNLKGEEARYEWRAVDAKHQPEIKLNSD